MELRNFLFKLLQIHPEDGYHVNIRIDGVTSSEQRNSIAKRLVNLGCLASNWSAVGRDGIQGQFNYDRIEEVVKSGEIG